MKTWIILLFLLLNYHNTILVEGQIDYGEINKTFTITNELTKYGVDLSSNDIQEKGIFNVTLMLFPGSDPLNFSYIARFPIVSVILLNNSQQDNVDQNLGRINGSLEPGQQISIIRQINLCMSDLTVGIGFLFYLPKDSIAYLHFSLEVLDKGKDTCPSQLGSSLGIFDFIPAILIVFSLLSIIYAITKNIDNKPESKSNELYPENKPKK